MEQYSSITLYSNTFRVKNLHDVPVQIAGWGRRFDFGYHDFERTRKGTYDDPTMYSACMTTHEGPEPLQYESCNTKEVN